MLADYINNGGKLLVMAGPVEGTVLTNLNALLADYGVSVNDGIVIEGNRSHYAFGYPYILMPDLESSQITERLIEENYSPILPLSQVLTIGNSSNGTVSALMTTSEDAFRTLAGFSLTIYEQEDGDLVLCFRFPERYIQCILIQCQYGSDHECPRHADW